MPLPADWNLVQVRWSGYLLDGTTPTGTIEVTPAVTRFVDAGEGTDADLILGRTLTFPISGGKATFSLPATDDPHVSPQSFTYLITENIDGGGGSSYSIEVPLAQAATGIDLAAVSPAASSPGIPVSVVTRAEFDALNANNAITNAKLADMPQGFKGRSTVGTGDPTDLTPAQAVTLLDTSGDLAELIRDVTGVTLIAGTNVTITPNDGANTITIASTGGGSTDPEIVRDTMATALVAGTNITITPNDAADTITISASAAAVTEPRLGIIRVASSQAPQDVKDQALYVCDGTNDQVEINQALLSASRASDGFGGIGAGCVELVGGDFFTSHDDTTTITMYPATWLRGSGPGVMLQPRWVTQNPGRGAIELLNVQTAHVRVSDMTIGRPDATAANGDGIRFTNNATATTYDNNTGGDPFIILDNLMVLKMRGKSYYVTGTGGGARETQISNCHGFDGTGVVFHIDSSDCKLTGCTAQPGSGGPGFQISGGNAKLANCKSYYAEVNLDGFLVSSSRAELLGCAAQDNGRWGFNITSQDATITGCVADSNQRLDTAGNVGGGFLLGGARMAIENLHCFDRAQSTERQVRGVVFSGTPHVSITGYVSVPTAGSVTQITPVHITGSPHANSTGWLCKDTGGTPGTTQLYGL